jgi:hypothetical protein
MSTVKTDAIAAVSTNGDLSLDGLGTGGVSIASTLKMTKGGDISSASPLVIDTDGNYFDVTGTTNFAAMTVESGNFFMLQFDSALTITHGSGIELPGAADLTTATGDRLICYATAADTVEVMSVETEAAASSGFTLATEQATTSGTSWNFGSIPSGTNLIIIMFERFSFSGAAIMHITLGDSGGLETTGYINNSLHAYNANAESTVSFDIDMDVSAANEVSGQLFLTLKDSTNNTWTMGGVLGTRQGESVGLTCPGNKSLSGTLTQVQIDGGTGDLGSINIMYQ